MNHQPGIHVSRNHPGGVFLFLAEQSNTKTRGMSNTHQYWRHFIPPPPRLENPLSHLQDHQDHHHRRQKSHVTIQEENDDMWSLPSSCPQEEQHLPELWAVKKPPVCCHHQCP